MENNPLLAMLKAAGASPANSGSSVSPAGPTWSAGSSARLSATSPPPPPTLRAVSLDDLFKSISQPPAHNQNHAPPANSHPAAPGAQLATSPPGQHQAKLLGMLSLGVGAGAGGSAQATPELSRPTSGPQAHGPSHDAQRRASLLSMLRSPPLNASATPALGEPVITHLAPAAPLPPAITSPPVLISPPPGVHQPTPSVGLTPGIAHTQGPPPAKSPFDFVSPFDAFDKPSQQPSQQPSQAASGQASAATQSPAPTPSAKSSTPPSPVKQREHSIPQAAATGTPASQVQSQAPAQAAPSPSSSSRKETMGPSFASKLLQGAEGKGPMVLSPGGVTIDMAQPNLDGVVNHPPAVATHPATIMKADSVGFSRGRTVGSAGNWIAYTLSRGRIRLLDMVTGARTIFQLDSGGPFVDLAVTPDALAVILADGSVNVYRVPPTWTHDDPECPLIFRLPPIATGSVPADKSLGDINQIEWVRRDGESTASWLAIGGTEGAVIVKPENWGEQNPVVNAREMLTNHRVLKASGLVVQFCLNATHQAIALISSSGYFCLYSVSSLNKVWHRQLPSSNTAAPLSSVRFCEAHIVVGRANDTMFDLVQITYELAVISTIKFTAPLSQLSFGNAVYDSANETLFISQFARGSVYAFRYKLKGSQPLRGVTGPDSTPVLAFDSMAEFPMEPIVSFVLTPNSTYNKDFPQGSPDLVYASPQGISRAQIDRRRLPPTQGGAVVAPAAAEVKPASQEENKEEQASVSEKTGTQDKPADNRRARGRVSSAEKRAQTPTAASGRKESTQRGASPVKQEAPVMEEKGPVPVPPTPGLTADELNKALKKTEDKLGNQVKQAIQAEFGSSKRGAADVPSTLTSAVTNHLNANLPKLVEQEVQRALPGAVQHAVHELLPGAVHLSLQNIGRDVERVLTPIVPRTLNTVVQPAVERAVRDAIQQALVPALDAATTRVYDQLASDLKTEMVQIRKDVVAEQGDALAATNDMIHSLSSMIEALQRQVATLSARSPAPTAAPAHSHTRSLSVISPPISQPISQAATMAQVHQSQHQQHQPLHQQPHQQHQQYQQHQHQQPSHPQLSPYEAKQLEDAFLAALTAQSAPATLKLVSDYSQRTEQILPLRPGRSPLSQSVLLTLVHRLSNALSHLAPHEPMFATAATWFRHAVDQLDPNDPKIKGYMPRVTDWVSQELNPRVQQLSYTQHHPLVQANVGILRRAIDELVNKSQGAA